ncbi:YceK/YidQ family lipoprotein [Geothermobacter ehrlichii]|uniref:YceK/YidQ family lipoprotein n=1 Tax=Geothermobacter ehrlichii TaxID=213224 RepID=UPI0011E63EBD|nr:YceK/YidQ family lipoprotein [Geothermobacter ehrlichii]
MTVVQAGSKILRKLVVAVMALTLAGCGATIAYNGSKPATRYFGATIEDLRILLCPFSKGWGWRTYGVLTPFVGFYDLYVSIPVDVIAIPFVFKNRNQELLSRLMERQTKDYVSLPLEQDEKETTQAQMATGATEEKPQDSGSDCPKKAPSAPRS